MPTPQTKDALLLDALRALRDADGNKSAAARTLGMKPSTFKDRVSEAHARGLSLEAPKIKPRIRVPARSFYQPMPNEFGKAVRVMVWGCAHDAPNIPDKSRFRHAGLLASELRPDFIVDLGDSLDLDSLSTHAIPGSTDDRMRPGFLREVESVDEAYGEFHATAPSPDDIPRYRCKGNHEHRADRFEANNPTTEGVYTLPLSQVFARYGWTEKQYREWLFIEGVGFTHAPLNSIGREVGGVNANQTVARETTFSMAWAHTHKRELINRPKFGIGNQITVFNTGTMMPQGYLKHYAGLATTGWTYGPSELTLRDGQIESVRSWSVLELAERYS
jgi:hypothetical protein